MLKKRCGGCKIEKDISNFYKNKRKKDGYQNYCVSCIKKTNADSFQKHKKKRMAKSLEWQRSEKGGEYHSDYYKHGSKRKREVAKQEVTPEVYQQQHVEHRAQYMATTHDERSKVNHERYERNKSDILAQQKEYRAKKKVRAEPIEVAPTKKTCSECDFCFQRSFASYNGLTPNGRKKVDCLVEPENGRLPKASGKKVAFNCDVCDHEFSASLANINIGRWCGMCSKQWKHCKNEACDFCFNRSFASYPGLTPNGKRKVDCLKDPIDVRKALATHKKFLFNCDVCDHDFSASFANIKHGKWCGMCSKQWKHCGKDDCDYCFNRSFASYSGLTPNGKRKVDCLKDPTDARKALGTHKKFLFNCDVCDHDFSASFTNIKHGKWCGMCSEQWKHCGKDDCDYCFNRSFASYSGLTPNGKRKVDCLTNKEDAKLPKAANKRCSFNCDTCGNIHSPYLYSVIVGHWCPCSRNKTELKVFNFLTKEMKILVKREYLPSFQWRHYKKMCRFDFLLVGLDIILEIDGPQHTQEVPKEWMSTTLLHRQIVDKWKEFMARRDGKKVFRFNQHAIWMDSYDWKREMRTLVNTVKDI